MNLKLGDRSAQVKIIVLHDDRDEKIDRDEEIYMT